MVSRKTTLQIKTKSDDDESGETTTTIKGGRSTSKNRSIKYVCPHCGANIRATGVFAKSLICQKQSRSDLPFLRKGSLGRST